MNACYSTENILIQLLARRFQFKFNKVNCYNQPDYLKLKIFMKQGPVFRDIIFVSMFCSVLFGCCWLLCAMQTICAVYAMAIKIAWMRCVGSGLTAAFANQKKYDKQKKCRVQDQLTTTPPAAHPTTFF